MAGICVWAGTFVYESYAPLFLVPFALGNILGPLLLGPLFDLIGLRPMIAFTYLTSGVLLIATGLLFTPTFSARRR